MFFGKHRIIVSETNNIIFAKQMHLIAKGDASFLTPNSCFKAALAVHPTWFPKPNHKICIKIAVIYQNKDSHPIGWLFLFYAVGFEP